MCLSNVAKITPIVNFWIKRYELYKTSVILYLLSFEGSGSAAEWVRGWVFYENIKS